MTWHAPDMSWLFERLNRLASADSLLVVVDRGDARSEGRISHVECRCLGGMGPPAATTTVLIDTIDDDLHDVSLVRRSEPTVRVAVTSEEASHLVGDLHLKSAATLYLGDGSHASLIEALLDDRDLYITVGRTCTQRDSVRVYHLEDGLQIVDLLYTVRRESGGVNAARTP